MIRITSNSACLTLWLTFPQISLLQNPSPKDTVAHTRKLGVISAWPDGPVRCLSLSTCSLISHHALSHPLHSSYADFLFNFSNTCSFLSGRFYKPVLSSWEASPTTSSLYWGRLSTPTPTTITHSHPISYFLSQCQSWLVIRYWLVWLCVWCWLPN